MLHSEIVALRKLYAEVAVARAIEEIDELFNLTDAEQEADRQIDAQLKTEAHACYKRARGLLATDGEFDEFVWPSICADLKREVKALMELVK